MVLKNEGRRRLCGTFVGSGSRGPLTGSVLETVLHKKSYLCQAGYASNYYTTATYTCIATSMVDRIDFTGCAQLRLRVFDILCPCPRIWTYPLAQGPYIHDHSPSSTALNPLSWVGDGAPRPPN